jgi:hypothetical protein
LGTLALSAVPNFHCGLQTYMGDSQQDAEIMGIIRRHFECRDSSGKVSEKLFAEAV